MKTLIPITIFICLLTSNYSFSQSSGDYRSKSSGNWNSLGRWEKYNGSIWATATVAPSLAVGVITILNGHTLIVTASVSIDQTIVNSGGQINVNSGQTLTIANGSGTDLAVNGTLVNSGTITPTGSISFGSGGTYKHAQNGGTIPAATWDLASNCNITGIITAPSIAGLDQTFGNLTWNCQGQTSRCQLGGIAFSIAGILTITSTGIGTCQLVEGNGNTVTAGSYIQTGGYVFIGDGNNVSVTVTKTLTVIGDFSITGGTFDMNLTNGTKLGSIYALNVGGNFTLNNGIFKKTASSIVTNTCPVYFNGSSTQTYSNTGSVMSGSINYTINSGTAVDFGTSTLNGSGTFILNSGGCIKTANTAGLTSAGATGSIQVKGTRTYSTGADYTYNSTSANQAVGNGLPATVNNLTINNTGGSGNNTVTLMQPTTVSANLTISAGTFDVSASSYNLNVKGNWSNSGTFVRRSGTVIFNGTSTQIIGGSSSTTFNNIIVNNSSPITALTLNASVTVNGIWNNSTNGNITINKNLTNNGTFTAGKGTYTFSGTSAQAIGGSSSITFNNLTVNNSFPVSALTLNAATIVKRNLTLQDGHVITTSANILILGTSATVSISTTPDSSFVKGPMIQTYNSITSVTKIFPVGKGNIMHRADLTIAQTNTTATQDTVEFFYSSATALGYTLPATLSKVSDIDYWNINNVSAANVSTAAIQLYYFPIDFVTDKPNLRVAKSDDAGNWLDIGGAGAKNLTGTITSAANFTTFSIFSFANAKGGSNNLPIELLSFDAKPDNDVVNITWTTTSETNNDYFTIEKSKDVVNFEMVTTIGGAGNSNILLNYSTKDNEPISGVSYYRLMQTDFDGKFTYSNLVKVDFIGQQANDINIYPNPFSTIATITINDASKMNNYVVIIYNVLGTEVMNTIITNQLTALETNNLPTGIYSYNVFKNDKNIQSGKLISQQ